MRFFCRVFFFVVAKKKEKKNLIGLMPVISEIDPVLEDLEQQRNIARATKPPEYIDNMFVFLQLLKRWTPENAAKQRKPTQLSPQAMQTAADLIDMYIPHKGRVLVPHKGRVLEMGSETCITSMRLCSRNFGETWMHMNYVQIVAKYGQQSNVLLFNMPATHTIPKFRPSFGSLALIDDNDEFYSGYCDYYAIKMFIEQESKESMRMVIFIGEIGVSSGSCGLYAYLLDHPQLDLVLRKEISQEPSPDHPNYLISHELFIFHILQK